MTIASKTTRDQTGICMVYTFSKNNVILSVRKRYCAFRTGVNGNPFSLKCVFEQVQCSRFMKLACVYSLGLLKMEKVADRNAFVSVRSMRSAQSFLTLLQRTNFT